MANQVTTHDLFVDGRATSISLTKVTPTSIKLSWTLPNNTLAYDGAVVLLSESPILKDQYPVDGTKYNGSTNWAAPLSEINGAKVVAAYYGFFGDDTTLSSVIVSNIDPDKLYYASIHVASNILQYHTNGSHSYPLEANDPTKGMSPYAGSIKITSFAPVNPYNGQVYYDTTEAAVLIWNDEQSAWIKIDQQTVPLGVTPPVNIAQLIFDRTSGAFQYFNGSQYVTVDATNLRVKMGSTWAPFNNFDESNTKPENPSVGTFAFYTEPAVFGSPRPWALKVFSLGQWFTPSPDIVQVLINGVWTPIFPLQIETFAWNVIPPVPFVGMFFYQTSTQDLMVWDGTNWTKADTDQEGVPAVDKVEVGTDGTSAARLELINKIKLRMGYPSICVELKEENFQLSLDNALAEFRKRADNAYSLAYIAYTVIKGQNTYYLNDPRDKTNRIVNVLKIHRVNMLGVSSLSSENGLYAQAFFNQLYQGSNVDILSIHLMNQLSESYERIFAGNLTFTWNEASRQLTVLRNFTQNQERVVLEVSLEKEEQELLFDRYAGKWIQDWAYAEAMETLGWIRTKYGTLPGANGGVTLNGGELLQTAATLKQELLRQMNDFEVGNGGVDFGNTAFMIG